MKGLDPSAARAKASALNAQLSSLDHVISELTVTHRAAQHPGSYGIDPGEQTIAPWSVGSVLTAKNEIVAARAEAAQLVARIHQEIGSQVAASAAGAALGAAAGKGMGKAHKKPVQLAGFHMGAGGGGGGGGSSNQADIDEMVELATAIASFTAGDEDFAALQALLDKYGDDEEAMAAFFDELGAANLMLLLEKLNSRVGWTPEEDAMLLSIAQSLRSALSRESATWDESEADAFVQSLFEDQASALGYDEQDGTKTLRFHMLAFLFSSPEDAPMGEQFALSAAEYADQWEHDNDLTMTLNRALVEGGLESLLALDSSIAPDDSWVEVSGRILETLGEYPDSAMEFLSEDGRVEYWYGERNSEMDGFEGVASLWEGAQYATGGPLDPNGTVPADAQSQAETTSAIMTALAGNSNFTTENLNDEASTSIANATSVYLPGIMEYLWNNESGERLSSGAVEYTIHGAGTTLITPSVTEETISQLLGEAGSHPGGAEAFNAAITGYQEMYMAMALNDPSLLGGSLERYAVLQGVLDGSSIGSVLDSAARHDAEMDAGVDAVKDVVGLIPIPMLSKLLPNAPDAAITLLNLGQRLVVNETKADGFESWKEALHTYDSVAAQVASGVDADRLALKMSVATITYQAVGAENGIAAPPTQYEHESTYSYMNRWEGWYDDNSAALEVSAGMDPGRLGNITTVSYGRTTGDAENEAGE